VRRATRFVVGSALGAGALVGYLAVVGVDGVLRRTAEVAPWVVGVALLLVVAEGLSDALGVWASVNPLGRGLSAGQSVQFAMAGDFFDTLGPAGPVSSEPIMARFIGVTTATSYTEALAVRGVAKYVKSGAQLLVSTVAAAVVLLGGPSPAFLVGTLGGAVLVLLVGGVAVVRARSAVTPLVVAALTPLVSRASGLLLAERRGRADVAAAVDRFWVRVLLFRSRPGLLGLIALGGVLEQVLTAAALWTALAGTGTPVVLLAVVAVVPLPQAASVVPVPASLGAYDVLLAGALVLSTAAPLAAATAAVLVVRTLSVPFGLVAGGVAVAFLRGWRPRSGAP